jgi:hypothetical protein
MGVARGGGRSPWFLARGRSVRRRTASRYRHRPRRCPGGESSGLGRGDVCRAGPDSRPDRDDRHGRRPQGVADAPRDTARPAGRYRCRGGTRRRAGPVGRAGARCAVCPSRDPGWGQRHVRRSALAPSVAGCPRSSTRTRGTTRASSRSSTSCPGSATSLCVAPGSSASTGSYDDAGSKPGPGPGSDSSRRGDDGGRATDGSPGGCEPGRHPCDEPRPPEEASGGEHLGTSVPDGDADANVQSTSPRSRDGDASSRLADAGCCAREC